MIGKIGCQPFRPVAVFNVDINAVAPPVVQNFVRVGSVQDKRKADDLGPKESERSHSVAGLQSIFNQGEFRIGVGPISFS